MAKSVTKTKRRSPGAQSAYLPPTRYFATVRDTLSEKVYKAFKRDIIRGVYQPGEPLTEKVLAKRYRGSRTPVRESALRLQQERLLRIVPNRGYFVSQITLQELNEIYEYRTAVECAAAELAATKGGDSELLARLMELAETSYRTDSREVPSREHREIMKAIQERNPELARRRMYDHIIQSKDKVLRLASSVPSRS